MHGKELEDKSRLSECGLDDETPTVHLVMRLPAPGTARRKRDPASASKEPGVAGASSAGARSAQGAKVKTEPVHEDDVAAMSFAGMRQLSDMLVDGDAMEFEQVCLGLAADAIGLSTPLWDLFCIRNDQSFSFPRSGMATVRAGVGRDAGLGCGGRPRPAHAQAGCLPACTRDCTRLQAD